MFVCFCLLDGKNFIYMCGSLKTKATCPSVEALWRGPGGGGFWQGPSEWPGGGWEPGRPGKADGAEGRASCGACVCLSGTCFKCALLVILLTWN